MRFAPERAITLERANEMSSCCHKRTVSALLMAACTLCGPAVSHGVQMAANLDRDTMYLGTRTVLVVEVANAASSQWPVVSPVEGLQITRYGSPGMIQDLVSGSIRQSYRFLINPTRTGVFEIPAVTIGEGPDAARQGPFTLRVQEAPLKFVSAQVAPPQIRLGDTATLTVVYQGTAAGKDLVVPVVKGLTLRRAGPPRVEVTRSQGMPVSIYQVEVSGTENGTYQIEGISLADVTAEPVTVQVSPFVITDAQAAESSLVAGGQALVHVVARGLPQEEKVSLVLPAGLTAQRTRQQYQGPPGTTVFSFEVTAKEPGTPTVAEIQLADGRKVALPRPIVLSVRQAGQGDILACRGSARSEETIVGEPFIVDYEVFFRGELQAVGIDTGEAEFANRPYITVEPVQDLSYQGWSGHAIHIPYGERSQATLLSGSGDLDGKKEQLLRFALKVTPLAAGEVDLKGVRVILRLVIKDEQRSGGMFFSSKDCSRAIDVPAHRVTDPPGKAAPAGYRGLVGTGLTYTTALDRATAAAMSPLTLTMKITGEGVTSQTKPPPLAEIRELNRDYDVSPSAGGGEVQDKTVTFSQVVRPRSESVKELPALPLAYYDYVKKDYETVYSLPIPITVTPGSVVGATAMQTRMVQESAAAESSTSDATTEIVALGANHSTPGQFDTATTLGPGGVIAVLLGGPLVIGGVWAGRTWRDRRRPLASLRRRQRELIHLLDGAGGRMDFHACLAEVVQSYLRLTFELPGGELSADTLARVMDGRGLDERLRCQIEELLVVCDNGRFASRQASESERNRLIEQTRRVLAALDRV